MEKLHYAVRLHCSELMDDGFYIGLYYRPYQTCNATWSWSQVLLDDRDFPQYLG